MSDVISVVEVDSKTSINGLINDILNEIYNICLGNLKVCGVYTYINLDILDTIRIKSRDIVVTDELVSYIISTMSNKDYSFSVYSLNNLDLTYLDTLDCLDMLATILEDKLSARLIEDGFKVCFKIDADLMSMYDGKHLVGIGNDNVFDRIIMKELNTISYDMVFIR